VRNQDRNEPLENTGMPKERRARVSGIVTRRSESSVMWVTADGPLLVRGPIRLVDEHGDEIHTRRRVNAICRCGRSARQPFCDGTHKIVPFSPRAVERTSASVPGTDPATDDPAS